MRVGDWNVAIGAIGGPGCGKSTYAAARVREITKAQRCYVIVHDPTMSFRGADVTRHASVASLHAALRTRPGGIHCLDVARGLDVVREALHVASVARSQRNPAPTLCVLDEIVTAGEMTPSYLSTLMQEAYALRRHRHIGFLFCSQRPQQAHPVIWEMATEIVIFRLTTDRQARYLEAAGVDGATIAKARRLPYFWHPSAKARPERIPADAPTSRRLSDCYLTVKL
jgi:hypothetical protein